MYLNLSRPSTPKEIVFRFLLNQRKFDFIHHLPIDFVPNTIFYDSKSLEKYSILVVLTRIKSIFICVFAM